MSSPLSIFVATVLALCYGRSVVGEHAATKDDCRQVARRFNDELKTQDDQIVHDQKRLGESLDS